MTTDRQAVSNRQNAQASTGPRSTSGKAKSRTNALKHGLRAAQLLTPDEQARDWEQFRSDIVESLQPRDALQTELAERAALLLWRLRRVARFEAAQVKATSSRLSQGFDDEANEVPASYKPSQRLADAREVVELLTKIQQGDVAATFTGDLVGWLISEVADEVEVEACFEEAGFAELEVQHYQHLTLSQKQTAQLLAIALDAKASELPAALEACLKLARYKLLDATDAVEQEAERAKANQSRVEQARKLSLVLADVPLVNLTRAEAHLNKQLQAVLAMLGRGSE